MPVRAVIQHTREKLVASTTLHPPITHRLNQSGGWKLVCCAEIEAATSRLVTRLHHAHHWSTHKRAPVLVRVYVSDTQTQVGTYVRIYDTVCLLVKCRLKQGVYCLPRCQSLARSHHISKVSCTQSGCNVGQPHRPPPSLCTVTLL